MTTAVQEKLDDTRQRLLALLEELDAETEGLRRTLQCSPKDCFGVKMRAGALENRALSIGRLSTKLVTLLELPYRLDGSRADSGQVEEKDGV